MSEFKQTAITFYGLENCPPCDLYQPMAAKIFKDKDYTFFKVMRDEQETIDHLKRKYNITTFPFMTIGEKVLHSGETAVLLRAINVIP